MLTDYEVTTVDKDGVYATNTITAKNMTHARKLAEIYGYGVTVRLYKYGNLVWERKHEPRKRNEQP
jgi:hypothetical protein